VVVNKCAIKSKKIQKSAGQFSKISKNIKKKQKDAGLGAPERKEGVVIYPAERQEKILEVLRKQGLVSVDELSQVFAVSRSTIRRDLNDLESQGYLKTHYGGASLEEDRQPSFKQREVSGQKKKMAIAEKALELVKPQDCLLMDAGTTVAEFAYLIEERINYPLTVMATALNIVQILERNKNISKIITGGIYRDGTRSLIGHLTEIAFEQIRIDKAFIGAGGIDLNYGLSNFNPFEAQTRKKMLEASDEVIVLCDSSKFGKKALVSIAPLKEIDLIITDNDISPYYKKELEKIGIKVLIVGVVDDENLASSGK